MRKTGGEWWMYDFYVSLLDVDNMPVFLKKYLSVPCLERLKGIGYFCGMDYASSDIYNFVEYCSRYNHSLSVALLTWKFTNNKIQTLAGLFHDVATPCFSHVIDYMNEDYVKQESTEEYTKYVLENDLELNKILKEDGILLSDICDFKKYSIVDIARPKLCADRLDGIILTGALWTKSLDEEQIKEIVSDVLVFENEDGEKELGFRHEDVAKLVVEVNKEIDVFCHSNSDNFMMNLLAKITKLAIESDIISYIDLYVLTEQELFDLLHKCDVLLIRELVDKFENILKEEIEKIDLGEVKVRSLKPLVNGRR